MKQTHFTVPDEPKQATWGAKKPTTGRSRSKGAKRTIFGPGTEARQEHLELAESLLAMIESHGRAWVDAARATLEPAAELQEAHKDLEAAEARLRAAGDALAQVDEELAGLDPENDAALDDWTVRHARAHERLRVFQLHVEQRQLPVSQAERRFNGAVAAEQQAEAVVRDLVEVARDARGVTDDKLRGCLALAAVATVQGIERDVQAVRSGEPV